VPLAFALGGIENTDNWNWFVVLLKYSIPAINDELTPVVIRSEREKGIYNAAIEQLPHNQHCYCVKHIEKNMKTRFKIISVKSYG
jgi:MULE transposase domain